MAAAVRYAPEDHSLPKPWKGLVDDRTGYLYFWNPETNVTQYERPPKLLSVSSSVHTCSIPNGSSYVPAKDDDDDVQYRNGGPKVVDSGSRFTEVARSGANGAANGLGNSSARGPPPPSSAPANDDDVSSEAYSRRHEITVSGGQVPPPLMSFETTGFPPELLRERFDLDGTSIPYRSSLCACGYRLRHNVWSARNLDLVYSSFRCE